MKKRKQKKVHKLVREYLSKHKEIIIAENPRFSIPILKTIKEPFKLFASITVKDEMLYLCPDIDDYIDSLKREIAKSFIDNAEFKSRIEYRFDKLDNENHILTGTIELVNSKEE